MANGKDERFGRVHAYWLEVVFQMKYFCKLIMEGDFPGAPDTDTWEIPEAEYDILRDEMGAYRQVNTLVE